MDFPIFPRFSHGFSYDLAMSWLARRHRETGLDGGRRTGSGDRAESFAAGRGAPFCRERSVDPWGAADDLVVTGTCSIFPYIWANYNDLTTTSP